MIYSNLVVSNHAPFRIALLEPQIPQNTGNIARTCAAFKLPLDLIEPLGFSLEDKYLKRAGLDYWPFVDYSIFNSFSSYQDSLSSSHRIVAFSKSANKPLSSIKFLYGDVLLFGREDLGLPEKVKSLCSATSSIPMPGGVMVSPNEGVRSLNLSVSVGIVAYQALQQLKLL